MDMQMYDLIGPQIEGMSNNYDCDQSESIKNGILISILYL